MIRIPSKQCFYCGALVARNGVGDHFPLPRCAGGSATVPCCESCHDMKDRFTLDNWPEDWVEKIIADFPKLSRETRLFIGKVLSLYAESEMKSGDDRIGTSAKGHVCLGTGHVSAEMM